MEKPYQQLREERLEVRSRYPDVTFPNPVLEPVWFGRRNLKRMPETKAIVDQNTGRVMNICSDQYKLVHYEDVVRMIEEVTSRITGYGQIALCPQIYSDGGKMRMTMKFPDAQHLVRTDQVVPKIDVFTSYDLSYKLMGKFGAFMLRCTNGMGVWKNFKRFARKHLQSLVIEDLNATLLEGLMLFGLQVEDWRKWNEAIIDLNTYNNVWELLPFSAAEKEKIEILPEISTNQKMQDALKQKELTVWGMNSILTQFVTHEIKSDLRKIEVEPLIAKTMELTYERLAA